MTPDFTVKPSQLINIVWVFLGGLSLSIAHSTGQYWVGLFCLIPLYKILDYACWTYDIYDDRIVESRGVFSVTTREVYFHRIKSVMMERPFWMRVLGVGSIMVRSSDQFTSYFMIYGIDDVEEFEEDFQDVIQDRRKENGMKEYEVFQM
jgi:uncharacterized membrane protein YdbT with pleckstrin-like domain